MLLAVVGLVVGISTDTTDVDIVIDTDLSVGVIIGTGIDIGVSVDDNIGADVRVENIGTSLIIEHVSLVVLHAPSSQSHVLDIKLNILNLTSLILSLNTRPVILLPLQLYEAVEGHSTHCLLQ